jgi:Ser/Thr protein kinase RdoA (MazF antagonist)
MATIDEAELSAWCARHLGSESAETLFAAGNLSKVFGLRLRDGRAVVVKVRPAEARLVGCAEVQRHLWRTGFPCPQPLAGPAPLDADGTGYAVSVESLVEGGAPYPPTDRGARAEAFAGLLARMIALAPAPGAVSELAPPPAWIHWDHPYPGVWPPPDDRDVDLNQLPDTDTGTDTAWLDELGRSARDRLASTRAAARVIGHCDWESHNIEFRGGEPWVVHDWDSVVSAAETVIVGVAAAMWPAGSDSVGACIEQSEQFLDAYQTARGRAFSPERLEEAWAAGTWIRAFNGRKFLLDGVTTLTRTEAEERARRAGLVGG